MSDAPATPIDPKAAAAEWYRHLAEKIQWRGSGSTNNRESHEAFIRGCSLGIPEADQLKIVARHIESAGGKVVDRDLRHNLESAASFATPDSRLNGNGVHTPPPPPPSLEDWWRKSSPDWTDSPAGFLRAVFKDGERVCHITAEDSRQMRVLPVWSGGDLEPYDTEAGYYYLCNPVTGQTIPNPRRAGKRSNRIGECVTEFRYAVFETDAVDKETALERLKTIPLPIAAIYTSGGKSVHALVKVGARSKEQWDQAIKPRKKRLEAAGFDPAALSAVRLTRLPFFKRNGEEQRLLYLAGHSVDFVNIQAPQPIPGNLWEALDEWLKQYATAEVEAEDATNDLIAEFGPPFRQAEDGTITGFNEHFWAANMVQAKKLVYDPSIKTFWRYEPKNGLFVRTSAESLRELIRRRLAQEARATKRPKIRTLATVGRLDTIVRAAMGIAEDARFFEDPPPALHVANGMIVEDSGEWVFEEGFDPHYRSRNQAAHVYTPGAKCPRFINELLKPMLPDPGDQLTFQKWAGMVLSGRNPAQRLLLLDGTPGRGKGVIQRVIEGLIGRQNTTELRTALLGERFEKNRYIGKTLLKATDVPGDFMMQKWANDIKGLIGGDWFSAEAKGANQQTEIEGVFNMMIVSNTRLRCKLDGDVGAWRRRLIILRTDSPPVKKRVPDFDKVLLREEGEGILLWAIEGYRLALADLSECGDLVLTDTQKERVETLLAESDALRIFVETRLARSSGCVATVDDILTGFADYCADRGWTMPPQAQVLRELPDLMLQIHSAAKSNSIRTDTGSKRGFRGVTIREEPS